MLPNSYVQKMGLMLPLFAVAELEEGAKQTFATNSPKTLSKLSEEHFRMSLLLSFGV